MHNALNLAEVDGYAQLSDKAKATFVDVYRRQYATVGAEYRKGWTPHRVREHSDCVEVHFTNGKWLHYCHFGTWG